MGNIKLPKNFTLSRESMKDTLTAFKANKSVVDVAREVFQVATPTSSTRPSARTTTPSLALVLVSGGSRFAASRTSVPPKALASSKAPLAPKEIPKEPIMVSESVESSSEEGIRSPPLNVSPIRAVGAIAIGGRATRCARTSKPIEAVPSLPIDKGKKEVENLSFTPDNELLNATKVNVESTLASVAEMLCSKMFGGLQMFLTLVF